MKPENLEFIATTDSWHDNRVILHQCKRPVFVGSVGEAKFFADKNKGVRCPTIKVRY